MTKTSAMTPFRLYTDLSLLAILFLSLVEATTQPKEKRQIYREQVLPSSGGKIPDGAFTTDRLALNRLNKAGISVPDGVLLEHRKVFSHPHANQYDPEDEEELVKIIQKPEDRFVASVGLYRNERPLTISSTYIIRKPTHATNIKTPNQQMPLHELLTTKNVGPYAGYDAIPVQGWRPFRFEGDVPTATYSFDQYQHPGVRGHQTKESVAYYPITVPLELPNKKNQRGRYPQGGAVRFTESDDVHNVLSWPYLLGEYTRLADEINTIGHVPYGHPSQHSLFFTPEVVPPFESLYYKTRERYARTSKEIALTENISKGPKSGEQRRVIKVRCTVGAENALDGHDAKCRLRY